MAILKFLHILFVFLWIGTLLTQTRLLGELERRSGASPEIIKVIKRIYCLLDLPAMGLALSLGMLLLIFKDDLNWKAPWLHMKLTFAFFLILCDCLIGIKIVRHAKNRFCPTFSRSVNDFQGDLSLMDETPLTKKGSQIIFNFLSYRFLYYTTLTFLIAILISIYIFKPLWIK